MKNTLFWKDLSPFLRQQFEENCQLLTYKRGDFIYRQGEKPQGLYFVQKGLAGLTIIGESSGKEHLLRFFKKEQFFGHRSLLSDEVYHVNAVALDACEFQFVPAKTIASILENNPILYKDIAVILAKELRRCETQHVAIIEHQVIPRVAQSLIYLKDLHPDHNWTRQEIANFCGSTVSTVIKALAQIEDQGLIKQKGRAIEILDREALLGLQD